MTTLMEDKVLGAIKRACSTYAFYVPDKFREVSEGLSDFDSGLARISLSFDARNMNDGTSNRLHREALSIPGYLSTINFSLHKEDGDYLAKDLEFVPVTALVDEVSLSILPEKRGQLMRDMEMASITMFWESGINYVSTIPLKEIGYKPVRDFFDHSSFFKKKLQDKKYYFVADFRGIQ